MKKKFLHLVTILLITILSNTINAQILISGYMANPGGSDSTYEYVQLIATQNIDFSVSNYSVVFINNGTALSSGWIAGNGISYGFNLTSGSVISGEVFYVGGSGKRISGSGSTDISSLKWIKTINNVTTSGDGFGNANPTGVLGNGGASADGIAIFSGLTSSLTSATIPIDAIFYGTAIGSAKPSSGGYILPNNDRYINSQGTFGNGTNTFLFNDATSNVFVKLNGSYNTNTNSWTTNRTGDSDTLNSSSQINQITSQITLIGGPASVPTIISDSAYGITQTSALCSGNVTSDGGAPIIIRGICWGTSNNPDTSSNKILVNGTIGSFFCNISNLNANTSYHFRAFAINSAGLSYGSNISFSTATSPVAPIVITGAISSITANSAIANGEIINDGGSVIIERGICWSTSINPTYTNNKVIVGGSGNIFNGNLTSLNGSTLYNVRAYAINSIDTSYGNNVTFTTSVPVIPCISIAELRLKPADNSTVYQLTNEVYLSCKISNRNQKYIQDTSAAILIDDPNPAHITSNYAIGDGITGIKGKLYNYFGLLEFIPIEDPGVASSTQNNIIPLVLTAANILDTIFMKNHQAKLVKIENITFPQANGVNKFVSGKKYLITQNTTTDSLFYSYIYNADYIGLNIPSGVGSIVGVINFSYNKYYITPRNKNDISRLNSILEMDESILSIRPNPATSNVYISSDKNIQKINIYNIAGQLIESFTGYSNEQTISVENLKSGLYIVSIEYADNSKSVKKLVKE